jgi:hypothetical protein
MSRSKCVVGGCLLPLVLGLTACGSPPTEQPGAGPVMGSTGAVASAPASRAADSATPPEAKPEGLSAEASGHTSPLSNSRGPSVVSPADQAAAAEQDLRTAREIWYGEMRESPDVTSRLQALEFWAQQRNDSLDPVTFALVDEDETVRTRAQELYEQQLMREAAATVP